MAPSLRATFEPGSSEGCALVPTSVVVRELRGDACSLSYPLIGREEFFVRLAVASRRAEFAAVRHCAREALARLGFHDVAILPGDQRAPQWPEGVTGSMTHAPGYCAAAVTTDPRIASLGIDAELNRALPGGVVDLIASPEERALLSQLDASDPHVHWAALLFSAKEAVYKAWYPVMHRWLGFEDVCVQIEPRRGRFTAHLHGSPLLTKGGSLRALPGRWDVSEGLLRTAIAVYHGG